MDVQLLEIDDLVLDALRRSVVVPREQQEYLGGTVDDALAEAAACPEANPWPRAAYADGVPVGFVMLSWNLHPDPPDPTLVEGWFLWKLMVAHDQQGRGYGRAIIDAVTRVIRREGATELLTSYSVGVGDPSGFYAALGFVPTGDLHEGEVVAALAL